MSNEYEYTTLFQLDKHQANGQKSIFSVIFFQQDIWDNVFYVADTLSNMHGTHKNSPYGQTLRYQKNSLFLGFFLRASSDKLGLKILRSWTTTKIPEPCLPDTWPWLGPD